MAEKYGSPDQPHDAPAAEQNPEAAEDEESEFEEEERTRESRRGNAKLLTTIQIIACLVVLAAALALRFSGDEVYQKVHAWYLAAVNDSLIAEEQTAQAKRVVVGLWDNLTASRPEVFGSSSQAAASQSSSQAAASQSSPQTASSQTAAPQSGGASAPQ